MKFTNGVEFTAKDVIYTFCRVPTVENSPSSFTFAVRGFTAVETPDPQTVVIKTTNPLPLVPNNLATLGILSAQANGGENVKYRAGGCEGLGTPPKSADFNDPAKAIGTGPYKLANYTRGTHHPRAQRGLLGRRAALGEGDLEADVERGRARRGASRRRRRLHREPADPGLRADQGRRLPDRRRALEPHHLPAHGPVPGPDWKTPGVKGTDKNPFLDKRVREAVSKAINRQAIVDRIMGGPPRGGRASALSALRHHEGFPIEKYDPEAAKKLLAEAGYPNGFEVTLGTPNDRYINDEKIAQAVAQMLTRIGIKTNVDAMTASTFFTRRNKFEFSIYLAGWGADSGEMSNSLNSLVATPADKGLGPTNRGRYSNQQVDELVMKAMATVDDAAARELLRQASKLAMSDYGIIPLHFEVTPWALKKGLSYKPRVDQYTLATEVTQVGS